MMNYEEFRREYIRAKYNSLLQDLNFHRDYLQSLERKLWFYSNVEIKCSDKVECMTQLWYILNEMKHNLRGWFGWIKEPAYMVDVDLEKLREIVDMMRKVLVAMLHADYSIVQHRNENLEKRIRQLYEEYKHLLSDAQFF